MLKKRIIPLLLWSGGRLVKTVSFGASRVVGEPIRTCKVYSDQDADELVLLHIHHAEETWSKFVADLTRLCSAVMMPITVGGAINSFERASELFDAGADKVLVNTLAYSDLQTVEKIANTYGTQALVIGVDFSREDDQLFLLSNAGSIQEKTSLITHLRTVQDAGAGEIFIQSKSRDGTKAGLDLEILEKVREITNVPIVVAGGVGTFTDLRDAFQRGADGVACGTIFNFGDNNPIRAKAYLRNYGIPLKVTV